jgi:hypothetical protein
MKHTLAALVVGLSLIYFQNEASAGCDNYEEINSEGAPRAIICYKDKCDKTTLSYVCSNLFQHFAGYSIGWGIHIEGEISKISWGGNVIDKDKEEYIECYEIDPGACHMRQSGSIVPVK